ncbi:MAG: VOC family protein [Vicinamibacteria bacterium]|jgi:catechol 2,3-dioxygenase-like lactoylglutathione lyase family enzyme
MLKDSKAFSGFSVDDVEAAKRFYGETLGLEVEEQGPGIALHLAGGNDVLAYGKEGHEPASFTILNFPVDEIEAAVAALAERGVEFERYEGTPLETDEHGIFRGGGPLIAWFKDPAGNVLSVIEDTQ